MGSWGATTADESKPKFLTTEEQKGCYADDTGWTVAAGGNGNAAAQRETLVAIGGLSGGTSATAGLGKATITSVDWVSTGFDKSDGGKLTVIVTYNEAVKRTGGIKFTVTNDTPARNVELDYLSGDETNRLTFEKNVGANDPATNAGDKLTLAANSVSRPGGSKIQDLGTNLNSDITHAAGITDSTTITVIA